MVSRHGLVCDTNNGFVGLVASELVEFFVLLLIGIVVVWLLTGSWELTGLVLVLDVVQNGIVWVWLKYLRRHFWLFKGKGL